MARDLSHGCSPTREAGKPGVHCDFQGRTAHHVVFIGEDNVAIEPQHTAAHVINADTGRVDLQQAMVAGNIGINVGVAAPMAFFPFSGFKDSFFGDLHAQGRHGVEFYTQTKVVVERWPREWTRTF